MSTNERKRKIPTADERRAAADLLRHQIRERNARQPEISQEAETVTRQIIDQQAEAEAKQQYHAAWQNYYQRYYERYYLAQLDAQRQRMANAESETDRTRRLRNELLNRVKTRAKTAAKSRHFKPILAGVIVVILVLFIQYNQVLGAGIHNMIAPASRDDSGIIVAGGGEDINKTPTLLIPKISVRTPIIFDLPSLDENVAQANLENGVINFPVPGASSRPGQNGNTVILGHSSGDLFSGGNYKFIFVQLNRLTVGDTFFIDYNSVRYAYQVEQIKIIAPNNLGALNLGSDRPYATLITCDPIGTNINRLLVIGRQISPDPAAASSSNNSVHTVNSITGNQPTLFERIFN